MNYFAPGMQGMTAYGMSLVNGTQGLTPYGMDLIHKTPQHLGPLGQQVDLYNRRQRDQLMYQAPLRRPWEDRW